MNKIPLTQGRYALVDAEDFDLVSKIPWHYDGAYAANKGRRNRKVYMHRLIMKARRGQIVDHINRNKLDNRRANLRIATLSQNLLNTGMFSHNTSGHKGVVWYQRDRTWQAQIQVKSRQIHLGRFESIHDATAARKEAEQIYFQQ